MNEVLDFLGCGIIAVIIVFGVAWLLSAIHSVVRAADALERIADALEDDEEEGDEE